MTRDTCDFSRAGARCATWARQRQAILTAFLCVAAALGSTACRAAKADPPGRDALVLATTLDADTPTAALIRSRIDGAVEMRFGNTPGELKLSTWEAYANERTWYLPGYNYKVQPVVFAEYRGPRLGGVIGLQLPVMADRTAPDGNAFPYIPVPDNRVSDDVLAQHFDNWNERWATYQDAYGYGNIFFPMSHESTGGADGGGFVWTDSSRWRVDPPENPDSMLIALAYWRWLFPPAWRSRAHLGETVNLSGATLDVALRGRNLDLADAHVSFWITCSGARWHAKQPLAVVNGRWTTDHLVLDPDPAQWDMSWSRGGAPAHLCLDQVESYGFAFRGIERGRRPTGVLDLDEFRLTRHTHSPDPSH